MGVQPIGVDDVIPEHDVDTGSAAEVLFACRQTLSTAKATVENGYLAADLAMGLDLTDALSDRRGLTTASPGVLLIGKAVAALHQASPFQKWDVAPRLKSPGSLQPATDFVGGDGIVVVVWGLVAVWTRCPWKDRFGVSRKMSGQKKKGREKSEYQTRCGSTSIDHLGGVQKGVQLSV